FALVSSSDVCSSDLTIFDLLSRGLAVTDDHGALRPQVAETIPSLANGLWKLLPDGKMKTTWKIRTDAQWQDGEPVTSDDFLFTYQANQDPDIKIARALVLKQIEGVQAPDPYTLVVRWNGPFVEADGLF